MGFFSFLDFGGNAVKNALRRNAVIIDVRPPGQYDQGRIAGSLNIPVDQVPKNKAYIKGLQRPVVVCGNGFETGNATRILQQAGIKEVYNGGKWERVLRLKKSL